MFSALIAMYTKYLAFKHAIAVVRASFEMQMLRRDLTKKIQRQQIIEEYCTARYHSEEAYSDSVSQITDEDINTSVEEYHQSLR